MTTPEDKLDALLKAGETPTIEKVVDVKQYKYISPLTWYEPTSWGRVVVPKGFLSDGDSTVIDLSREVWFAHDRLYAGPKIGGKRVSKWTCDAIYGQLLLREARRRKEIGERLFMMGAAYWRTLALTVGGWVSWRTWRRREAEEGEGRTFSLCMLPNVDWWEIPVNCWETAAVRWIGPKQ